MKIGDRIYWVRPYGGAGTGIVQDVYEAHWLTGKRAYFVQGGCENLVVHEIDVIDDPTRNRWLT